MHRRHYEYDDLKNMDFNHWSRKINESNIDNLHLFIVSGHALTLVDNKPIAILSFNEMEDGIYDGRIMADKSFGKSPKHAIYMRDTIKKCVQEFKPKEVITISEDNDGLNKWHEFLGFKMIEKGVTVGTVDNLIKWSLKWELK